MTSRERIDPVVTDRLILRNWRHGDREPFAALNADPEVMRHLPGVRTRAASDAMVDRLAAAIARDGYGLWAVEVADAGDFVGFTGMTAADATFPCAPAVEIGWRLARHAWGHGYATEAARACLEVAFDRLKLPELVSVTAPANVRSQAVMRRLGMTRDPSEDFDLPSAPGGRAVLYRLEAASWRRSLSEGGAAG
ncbi:MAG: GNAT family N-acetyltransferase [Stackebrandtia sp.]